MIAFHSLRTAAQLFNDRAGCRTLARFSRLLAAPREGVLRGQIAKLSLEFAHFDLDGREAYLAFCRFVLSLSVSSFVLLAQTGVSFAITFRLPTVRQ